MSKPRSIAISGKGGAGKTALTAIMAKILTEGDRKRKTLLIDADPAGGLTHALGVSVEKTIGEIRADIIRSARKGDREEKKQIANTLDYMILEALVELKSFSLLAMGRPETTGCFCPVNDLLRDAIEMLLENFDLILIDGEAGLEQINRQVIRSVNSLIIVTDPSRRGIRTAVTIKNIAETHQMIKSRQMALVVNRVRETAVDMEEAVRDIDLKLAGCIPEDENITGNDSMGKPLLDLPGNSPGVIAVQEILNKLGVI